MHANNNFLMTLTFVLSVSMFSGCASIITGTDQTVTFNSEPDGATVTVSGLVIGKTPVTVPISKGKNQSLTFEKEGYKTYTTQLSTSFNGWFWGNIIFGGLLGSTTDGVSGAIHEFSPDQYFVTLTPETSGGVSSSKPRKIKELFVLFGETIRTELSQNGGEKSDAILELLSIDAEDKESSLMTLKLLSEKHSDDLELANKIIEFYEVK